MAALIPCPFCKADIEDDSIFCDQCGQELLKCQNCGKLCKGKFCPSCGAQTKPASQIVGSSPQPTPQPGTSQPQPVAPRPQPSDPQPQVQAQPQPYSQPTYQPQPQVQPQPSTQNFNNPVVPTTNPDTYSGTSIAPNSTSAGPTTMNCRSMGIILQLQPGAIIGRVTGNYTAQLGVCNYISGTHARLDFNGANWTITDLGSRNGSAVNGVRCMPNQPMPFRAGDVVRLANYYDFYVS